jgi:hypothetical protein
MTFTRKISQIPTAAAALTATDRLEVAQGISTTPVTRYLTPGQITDYVETDISTLPNGLVTNAMVNASAAIAYTKLSLTSSIVNADVASGAAIAYTKLALTSSIVNADVASGAAIVDTKLATIATAGKVSNSATTATNANTASAIVARDASGDVAVRDASVRQVILRGDTSGTATVKVPAIAGTPTFTLPAGVGTVGQVLSTDGAGILSWATAAAGSDTASDVMFARFNFR